MLGKMKIYTVHIKPEDAHAYEKPVFVREGMNIWAFLLPLLWALYEKLWWKAAMIFAIEILLMFMAKHHVQGEIGMLVIQLGFHFWVAQEGNDWIRAGLAKRGYITSDIVSGDSAVRAQQRYFDRVVAAI